MRVLVHARAAVLYDDRGWAMGERFVGPLRRDPQRWCFLGCRQFVHGESVLSVGVQRKEQTTLLLAGINKQLAGNNPRGARAR